MNGPRLLIVRLLEACNAGCFMCEFANSTDRYKYTYDESLALLDQIKSTTVNAIRFTGGEPLLVPWISEIICLFSSNKLHTSIITNGWDLANKAKELNDAKLRQVIVSLDAANERTHDRARRLPGLFSRAIGGMGEIKSLYPDIRLRVNTVVGPHNAHQLPALWELLSNLEVEHWSIIPLKKSNGAWRNLPLEQLNESVKALEEIANKKSKPKLIGYSAVWAGREVHERLSLSLGERPFTPKGRCNLVDSIRYLVPKENVVFPCNCVPHRDSDVDLFEPISPNVFLDSGLQGARDWLRINGPQKCRGCEPANAALAEGLIDLEDDPLAF